MLLYLFVERRRDAASNSYVTHEESQLTNVLVSLGGKDTLKN